MTSLSTADDATLAFAAPPVPAADAPTEALAAPAGGEGEPQVSGIEALFGEPRFTEYEREPAERESATTPVATAPVEPKPKREPGTPLPRRQKALLWAAGGVVGVLALVVLFFLGTRLPQLLGPAPAVVASPSPTPTPTATVPAVGPLAAGTYDWDRLLGGECLDPYASPWEEEYTVVDCATPHAAQLVARGTFAPATAGGDGSADPYPGVDALQSQINLLCTTPSVIDLAAAGQFSDIQFQASFAATERQWLDGDHDYYCFVSRSGGDPLTASIAVPQAPPAP